MTKYDRVAGLDYHATDILRALARGGRFAISPGDVEAVRELEARGLAGTSGSGDARQWPAIYVAWATVDGVGAARELGPVAQRDAAEGFLDDVVLGGELVDLLGELADHFYDGEDPESDPVQATLRRATFAEVGELTDLAIFVNSAILQLRDPNGDNHVAMTPAEIRDHERGSAREAVRRFVDDLDHYLKNRGRNPAFTCAAIRKFAEEYVA